MEFFINNNELIIKNGDQVKYLKPKQTKFVQSLLSNNLIVVLEDYYGFSGSNLYALDSNGNTVWTAELPHESDSYTGNIVDKSSKIKCPTWNGLLCEISTMTGKIVGTTTSK